VTCTTQIRLRHVVRNTVAKSTGEPESFIGLEDIAGGAGRLVAQGVAEKAATDALAFEPGDVLVGKLRPYLAKSLAPTDRGTCTSELLVMRPGPRLDARFLLYLTLSEPWLDWAVTTSYGTKMPRTSWDAMADFAFTLPPLGEQRRIADFLDTETARLDSMVEVKRHLADLTRERFRSVASASLFGDSDGAATVDSGIPTIGPIPADWRTVRNKDLFREVADLTTTGTEELLSVSHLTGVTPRSEKNVTMFMAESLEGYKRVVRGDLVVNTMWAWMGALGVSHDEGIVSPAYGVYRSRSGGVYPPYFDLVYRSPEYVCEMTRHSKGVWTSRLRLYPEAFLALRVPLPPLAVQVRVADVCHRERERSERIVRSVERSLDVLDERRQALITAAVTGQLDVTTARGGHS